MNEQHWHAPSLSKFNIPLLHFLYAVYNYRTSGMEWWNGTPDRNGILEWPKLGFKLTLVMGFNYNSYKINSQPTHSLRYGILEVLVLTMLLEQTG